MQKKTTNVRKNSVGRDQVVSGGNGSIVIGGDARNNVIIQGNNNRVGAPSKFLPIYEKVDVRTDLATPDKTDLKSELQSFEDEDKKGPEANEGFLAQRLRNVKRIAPDILEVVFATIGNPAAGFGMIAKKVADKMKASAN